MGAIKDIVDLCIKLRDENKDGKIAGAIGQIQSLTLALQSEQAAITEKNAEFLTENLELKRKIFNLEDSHSKAVATLQISHREEIAKIAARNLPIKSDGLKSETEQILKYFFDKACSISDEEIASCFSISLSVAGYHMDILLRKKFITQTRIGVSSPMGKSNAAFAVSHVGRAYCVENGLAP